MINKKNFTIEKIREHKKERKEYGKLLASEGRRIFKIVAERTPDLKDCTFNYVYDWENLSDEDIFIINVRIKTNAVYSTNRCHEACLHGFHLSYKLIGKSTKVLERFVDSWNRQMAGKIKARQEALKAIEDAREKENEIYLLKKLIKKHGVPTT